MKRGGPAAEGLDVVNYILDIGPYRVSDVTCN
jgi:hypothetical protein